MHDVHLSESINALSLDNTMYHDTPTVLPSNQAHHPFRHFVLSPLYLVYNYVGPGTEQQWTMADPIMGAHTPLLKI